MKRTGKPMMAVIDTYNDQIGHMEKVAQLLEFEYTVVASGQYDDADLGGTTYWTHLVGRQAR